MSILDGMFTGFVLGLVFSAPAFAAEFWHHRDNLPLLVDVKKIWGRAVPSNEVLAWSTALFLALATVFGGVYPLLAQYGLVSSYSFASIAVYALAYFLFTGLLAAPLFGMGLFFRREGRLVWLELLISYALLACGYWYATNHLLLP